jgi:hypothetical protein
LGPELLSYAAAIALAGALAGVLIGFVIRGARARRQAEKFTAEVKQLKEKLENASKSVPAEAVVTSKRWTGNEVAAAVGAIAALLGAVGAIMGNYQGKEIKELKGKLAAAEASTNEVVQKHDILNARIKEVMGGYDIKEWEDLRKEEYAIVSRKKPLSVELNNRQVSAPCDVPKNISLSYAGTRPSILYCKSGKASLILELPTRVLLIPASSAQSDRKMAKLP